SWRPARASRRRYATTVVMGTIVLPFPICMGMQALWEMSEKCNGPSPKQQEAFHTDEGRFRCKASEPGQGERGREEGLAQVGLAVPARGDYRPLQLIVH